MSNSDARIVLHTRNAFSQELITMVLRMPKFIVAEFNTSRSMARNSASSRAIPHNKFKSRIEENPFIPLFVKHEKGMTANEPLSVGDQTKAEEVWKSAMQSMMEHHERLVELNVSKGQANRLLESFFYTEVIATNTRDGWKHFFDLRAKPEAQTEIQIPAYAAQEVLLNSTPTMTDTHIPFSNPCDPITVRLVDSVVNCARVSYFNHEGVGDNFDDRLRRFRALVREKHPSPFEHQAASLLRADYSGNFSSFGPVMFCQLRKVIEKHGLTSVHHFFKGFDLQEIEFV